MKLPQSGMESATGVAWVDEMWSMLQCGVLLLLGYLVARAWLWYRNTLLIKAKLQHVHLEENDAVMPNDNQEVKHIASDSPSRAKYSKQANAQIRKRLRKRRVSESSNDPDKNAAEEQGQDSSAQQFPEEIKDMKEVISPGVVTEVCSMEASPDVSSTVHERPVAYHVDGDAKEAGNDKADTDMQQDMQTPTLTDVSCTLHEIPIADDDDEKHADCYANEAGNDESDTACGTAEDIRTPTPVTVLCTKDEIPLADGEEHADCNMNEAGKDEPDMYMDQEHYDRNARWADFDEVVTDIQQDIPESTLLKASCTLHESPLADDEPHQVDNDEPDMAMQQSAHSNTSFHVETSTQHWMGEHRVMLPLQESPTYRGEAAYGIPSNIDWDLIESDSDDESDIGEQTVGSQRRDSAPVLYCSAPQSPVSNFNMSCVDGWVAVTVPAECAPPGTLNGRWMNRDGEKILIERLEILFESGVAWTMTMFSPTQISVDIEGVEFTAELDQEAEHLVWSDGDVWDFHGRVDIEDQPQQIAEGLQVQWPDPNGGEPTMQPQIALQQNWDCPTFGEHFIPMEPMQDATNCMIWEGMPLTCEGTAFMSQEATPFMAQEATTEQLTLPPLNQMPPADAKDWEICWDWKKNNGWCPRGDACEWYHPPLSTLSRCQPCDAPFY